MPEFLSLARTEKPQLQLAAPARACFAADVAGAGAVPGLAHGCSTTLRPPRAAQEASLRAGRHQRAVSDWESCLSSCEACGAAGDGGGDGENVSAVDEWEEAVVSCKEETSRVPLKPNVEKTKDSCRGTRGASKHMASGN